VAAAAAIVGVVAPLALGRTQADGLAVIGIAALLADDEPLQKIALTAGVLPIAAPVLLKLLADRLEQRLIDQGRNRHANPLARGHIINPMGPARLLAAATHRAQPGRHRPDARLSEARRAAIGGVPEDPPHGAPIPDRLAAAGQTTLLLETPTRLANADALAADPVEDPPHDLSLVFQDLVAGHASAIPLADVAVAVG